MIRRGESVEAHQVGMLADLSSAGVPSDGVCDTVGQRKHELAEDRRRRGCGRVRPEAALRGQGVRLCVRRGRAGGRAAAEAPV